MRREIGWLPIWAKLLIEIPFSSRILLPQLIQTFETHWKIRLLYAFWFYRHLNDEWKYGFKEKSIRIWFKSFANISLYQYLSIRHTQADTKNYLKTVWLVYSENVQSLVLKISKEQWHKVNKENSILLYLKPNCGRLLDWSWLSFNIFCADWFHFDRVTYIIHQKNSSFPTDTDKFHPAPVLSLK